MIKPLHEVNQLLMEVLRGEKAADTVLKNATIVNVLTGKLDEGKDVAIKDERICFVGDCKELIGAETTVMDCTGKFIAPGFIDGHMHVESTMLSVTSFAQAAVIKGTTAVFMDPHEMANVFGLAGVELMHNEGKHAPIHVFTTVPSCVPSAVELEDAGSRLTPAEVDSALDWDGVYGLGEMMNYPGVIAGDAKMLAEINATTRRQLKATGHFPEGTTRALQTYLLSGVDSCHETVTKAQALEKLALGMHVMIREGSAWQDVKEVIKVLTEDDVNDDLLMLVTDDIYPETLKEKGQINHVIRRAIEEGVHPVQAIKLATLNTARYFGVDHDYGSVSPNKSADLVILDDLTTLEPTDVFVGGHHISKNGQLNVTVPAFSYPAAYYQSVHVKALTETDFLKQTSLTGVVEARVIEVIENSARTKATRVKLKVEDGIVYPDLKEDVISLVCFDRHHQAQQQSVQFVKGFGIKRGAVASTVAHDSHNLIVMGVSPNDMKRAAEHLAEIGGGMVVVLDGEVIASVPLPIAGLMSAEPIETLLPKVRQLAQGWQTLGCSLHAPFMTFSLIALPVIPDIRITNRGLVDVTTFTLIDTLTALDR